MKQIAILLLVALAACESGATRAERQAAGVCQRQGFTPGTAAWAACFGPAYGGLMAGP